MHILLVGGEGFLGRGLVPPLLDSGNKITVWDIARDLKQAVSSLTPRQIRRLGIDAICNLSVHADLSGHLESTSSLSWRTNVLAVEHQLNIARELQIPFINFSTREVLGTVYGPADVIEVNSVFRPKWLVTETQPLAPTSAYGETKIVAEWLTSSYDLGYTIRLATPYGNEVPQQGGGLIAALIRQAREGQIELTMEGKQFRDPVHTNDIATLIELIFRERPANGTYNCGFSGENLVSLVEIVRAINPDTEIRCTDGIDYGFAFDTSRATTNTGWTPKVRLLDMVRQLEAHYP